MYENIRRHGNHIRLGGGVTATEGRDGNLPTLTIRKDGKIVNVYRGSSLIFPEHLGEESKAFLACLGDDYKTAN